MLRRALLLASCFGAVVAAPALLAKSDVWKAELMKGYGDWSVYPNDINESGKVVGSASLPSGEIVALAWDSPASSPEVLESLPGDEGSWAADVNANGTVCGISGVMGGASWRAVTWNDKGKVTDRHPEGWGHSDMWSLNNAGEGAGEVVAADLSMSYACYWPSKGDAVILDLPSGTYGSWAICINEHRLIAGAVYPWWAHACYWDGPDGDLVDIHEAIEDAWGDDLLWSLGYEVTDDDEIVGYAGTEDWRCVAFVFTEADGVTILDAGGTTDALAWQSAGKYVLGGVGGDPASTGMTEQAAVWERSAKKGLTSWTLSLIDGIEGYDLMMAVGANKQGCLVGAVQGSDGYYHPWYAKRSGK